ncbi:Integral membrane protein OS=Streptomyces glaucescens OX=1907 GN=SGLAU_01460 PE=4 SV=1 [Streptomyces glaucescens]
MSGNVWLPPGARPDSLPVIPRQRTTPGWAHPDPIDELAERLEDFTAAAVHPDEIAALLESDGLSDDRIRERYGVKDSFALAEELYARVDRRHPEPDGPVPDPWQVGLLGCLLRGVVFALPGLAYVLGAPLLAGPDDDLGLPAGTVPLLAGALTGWTWNQGLAHRAHSWLGLGDRSAARRCLLAGAPLGALLGALTALAVADTADPGALAFAAGQSCYLGAATVLLVMGRERALLAALSPMAAGAVAALVTEVPEPARIALLLGSLAVVSALALLDVAPALREPGEGSWTAGLTALLPFGAPDPLPRRAGGPRLTGSVPYALFGLGSGVLVLHAALGDVLAGGTHSAVAAPAAVALTLSMGPAEWLLYRFRSGSLAALRSTGTPRAFRRAAALILVRCLAGYLAALLALAPAATALWPGSPEPTGVRLAGLLLLGVVLWTGLLLQSFGAIHGAAAVCCTAALVQTLALVTRTGEPHGVAMTVYGACAVVQAALVCVLLGRASAHR